jgi:FAD/FMN-containing dehydrogenase
MNSPFTKPRMADHQQLIAELQAITGKEHVLNEGDLTAYVRDWRGRFTGRALAVVRPGSTAEVSAIVRLCGSRGVAIVPQGGNTGLVGGSIPDESGNQVVIQLGRMSRVRALDPENMTVTVEAGCVLQELQARTRQAGFLFPLSLGAEGSCMVGGNLATNAGGTQVIRYGNTRELCLGLEVVTPSGDVWNGLSGLRKDNTGYDLRDLYIGSEGTLGVITAATMKLYPLPAGVSTAWVAASSLDNAVKLLTMARSRLDAALGGFEVMDRFGLSLVAKHMPDTRVPFLDTEDVACCVLIECTSAHSENEARHAMEALLNAAFEDGTVLDAVIAESLSQAEQLWLIREHIVLVQPREGPNVKHDVSLPISRIPDFAKATKAALEARVPGVRVANFGHLGDGNLHYNVLVPEGGDPNEFLRSQESRITDIVYRSVHSFGGSFSAEHGIGHTKIQELEQFKCPTALVVMRAIKDALDPMHIMNPGRVLALPQAKRGDGSNDPLTEH